VDPNAGKDYEWGSISKEQQDQFCLTLRYVECPFFVAPEGKGG
jgi:hypothetical protein